MSFSTQFYAKTPGEALVAIQEKGEDWPEVVRLTLQHILAEFAEDQPVAVKLDGHIHLAQHGGRHAHSRVNIEVAPIHFYENTNLPTEGALVELK